MAFDPNQMKKNGAICKYVYKNPNLHRNTVCKELVKAKKFASRADFNRTLDGLVAMGKILAGGGTMQLKLNPELVKTGVIQQKGDEFFIVTPNSNKHLPLRKSIVSGYQVGDVVDIWVERTGNEQEIFILGKNKSASAFQAQNSTSSVLSKKISFKSEAKRTLSPPKKEKPLKQTKLSESSLLDEAQLLGRVVKLDHDEMVFIPNDKNIIPRHIPILNNRSEFASFENKICVMNVLNIQAPTLGGTIVSVKGDAGNPIHEYEAIADSVGATIHWNGEKLQKEISEIPTKVDLSKFSLISEEQAIKNHRGKLADLRNIPFCPTDPVGARDKDDAIYSTYDEDGNIVVYTAIANVPKYVDFDSEIAEKYFKSIFTFYAPNRAYGALPTELSTGICSLTPGEDRLAFVVKRTFDKNTGNVISSNFFDAVINCKKQYSYDEAQEIVNSFAGDDLRTHFEWKTLTGDELNSDEQVLMDYFSGQFLKALFLQRQMLRFNSNREYKPRFDQDQTTILDIEKVKHFDYNEVIEFFMITSNEATAEFAKEHNIDTIFRTHKEPSTKKSENANEFFELLGIDFDGNLTADGIRNLISLVKGSPDEELVNQFLIKMQSRAVYSSEAVPSSKVQPTEDWFEDAFEQISHFALQSKAYSHTTAPIRRATDYVVIYNILAYIHGTKPLSKEIISKIIEQANEMQKTIDEGEKAIASINGVLYAENHIGEQMRGRISKVRYTSPEEGHKDHIVAVVVNDDKGICAEIPISQITGKNSLNYSLSPHGNAVVDNNGNVIVKVCQSLDFIIEKADRKSMNVIGKTNKQLVSEASAKNTQHNNYSHLSKSGKNGQRIKRYEPHKKHNNHGKHKNSHHEKNHKLNPNDYDLNASELGE